MGRWLFGFVSAMAVVGLLGFTAAPRLAFTVQAGTLFNTEQTSGANAAVSQAIAASGQEIAYLHAIDASCSAGTATLSVDVGGTTIWSKSISTRERITWSTALTGSPGTAMTVSLAACGAGNTGTLTVQANRF